MNYNPSSYRFTCHLLNNFEMDPITTAGHGIAIGLYSDVG